MRDAVKWMMAAGTLGICGGLSAGSFTFTEPGDTVTNNAVRCAWTYVPAEGEQAPKCFYVTLTRERDGAKVRRVRVKKSEVTFGNLEIDGAYTVRPQVCNDRGGELFGADRRFRTPAAAPRVIVTGVCRNFRDLGGWMTTNGTRVCQGLVYRSQGLNDNADTVIRDKKTGSKTPKPKNEWKKGAVRGSTEDRRQLRAELGIRTELDLRSSMQECWGMDRSPLGRSVDWRLIPSRAYDGIANEDGRKAFVQCFRTFLNPANYPIVFHCIGGADRTGTLGYVLNGLLGVGEEDLDRDYLFTAPEMDGVWPKYRDREGSRLDTLKSVFAGYSGETINARIEGFVLGCGIKVEEIEEFRRIMFGRTPVYGAECNGKAYKAFLRAGSAQRRIWMRDAKFRDAMKACDRKWNGDGKGVPRFHGEAGNLRDLGGWRTADGRRIRFGRLFRSAQIDDPKERTRLVERFGMKTDLDLRIREQMRPTKDLPAKSVPATDYEKAVAKPEWLRAAFDVLLDEANYPIDFHCAMGADRTGTLAAALELVLGVDEDDVFKDWQLTAFYNRNPLFESVRYDGMMEELAKLDGATWQRKAESWLHAAGITDAEIAKLKDMLLEKPRIEIGLVSDTHICCGESVRLGKGVRGSDETFLRAMRWMSGEGVDVIVNAGDVTEMGLVDEAEKYVKLRDEEFPDGLCRDLARRTDHFSVWGNHDVWQASYMRRPGFETNNVQGVRITGVQAELGKRLNGTDDTGEGCLKEVNGVWFGGVGWGKESSGGEVIRRLGKAAGKGGRAFFVQHNPGFTKDEAEALEENPGVYAFTGHSHRSLLDPSVITARSAAASSTSSPAMAAIVRVWPDGSMEFARRDLNTGDRIGSTIDIPPPIRGSAL